LVYATHFPDQKTENKLLGRIYLLNLPTVNLFSMMNSHANLTEFTAQAMEDGFDEVVQKEWAPNLAVGKHTHPFDVKVQLSAGQVELTFDSGVQTYQAGQGFFIARGVEHSELYGSEGATFWVARKL
jgi:hypothetical protein